MDRLDELTIFRVIAETGSLARAARRLRRSPPAVTRALSALEDRAGVRLIERTTRRLVLTEAGRELFERARSLLADYEGAVHGQADAPVRDLLRVTAPVTFGRRHMAPLVSGFLDRFPDTQVELVLNDRNVDLIEERLDAALRIGRLRDSTLVARKVGEVRRVLVASPAYLAARGAPKTPTDLEAHDTILGALWSGAPEWRFGAEDRATVVRLTPRLLVNDAEAVLYATRAGRGIARLLSYQAADDLAAGTLARLMVDFEPEPLPVSTNHPERGASNPEAARVSRSRHRRLRALPVIHSAATPRDGPVSAL
jgi:DNA-binding transcriptional LysR family regulator